LLLLSNAEGQLRAVVGLTWAGPWRGYVYCASGWKTCHGHWVQ